jgi:hypothetical protein
MMAAKTLIAKNLMSIRITAASGHRLPEHFLHKLLPFHLKRYVPPYSAGT